LPAALAAGLRRYNQPVPKGRQKGMTALPRGTAVPPGLGRRCAAIFLVFQQDEAGVLVEQEWVEYAPKAPEGH